MELNIPVKYRQDVENAAKLLKDEGCEAIFLFGSLVTGKIHDNSDIDIGIKGLSPQKFFRVYANLDKEIKNKIDLVDFDVNEEFYLLLNSINEVVKIG